MKSIKLVLSLVIFFTLSAVVLAAENVVLPEALQTAEKANFSTLYTINKLDVFDFFDLESTYDTDLKKINFKKTPEYTEKLNTLRKQKSDITTKRYYIQLGTEVPSYDVKRRGFEIYLGGNWGWGTGEARAPKSYERFLFEGMPTKTNQVKEFPKGFTDENFFLPMSEAEGALIENNRDSTKIFFLFNVSGTKKVKFKYVCMTYGWYEMTPELIKTEDARVIIANIKTGEIYYNQAMAKMAKGKPQKKS